MSQKESETKSTTVTHRKAHQILYFVQHILKHSKKQQVVQMELDFRQRAVVEPSVVVDCRGSRYRHDECLDGFETYGLRRVHSRIDRREGSEM